MTNNEYGAPRIEIRDRIMALAAEIEKSGINPVRSLAIASEIVANQIQDALDANLAILKELQEVVELWRNRAVERRQTCIQLVDQVKQLRATERDNARIIEGLQDEIASRTERIVELKKGTGQL